MMTLDPEARIAALPCWRGKVKLEPLHGGLSNTAFVVDDGRERYVARCGDDIPVHHVFRDRERAASVAAHAAGLARIGLSGAGRHGHPAYRRQDPRGT